MFYFIVGVAPAASERSVRLGQAAAEAVRADTEAVRPDEANAALARLRAEIARLHGGDPPSGQPKPRPG